MLNPDLKLNPNILDPKVEKKSMRAGFGEGLLIAGQTDKNVVALCADLTDSVQMNSFRKKFHDRFLQIGVAEQNLVTVASGMAAMGKIPFAASYAIFSPGRNWEQIRTTICYNNVPVKIIGSHVGVSVGPDGGSHQALEDIALMRVLPRMVVISPSDAIQAKKAAIAIASNGSPSYMRLARDPLPLITSENTPFEIGKAQLVYKPESHSMKKGSINKEYDATIIATGSLVHKAILTAEKLSREGRKVAVMNVHTIKPLDEEAIVTIAQKSGALITVEEHQIIGGLGSAVAECTAKNCPVHIEFIGIKDSFGQSGSSAELIEFYELGEMHIYKAVQRAMLRR